MEADEIVDERRDETRVEGDAIPRLFARGVDVRRARLERVLSQRELAEKGDVGVSTIRAVERSGRVSVESARKIARALDVDVSTIVEVRDG